MKIQLLNDRFTFEELNNDEKIICRRIRFSAIAHFRGHLSPQVRKICPIIDVPFMG